VPGLAEFELRVLLGVLRRRGDAYAVTVRDEIVARTGREVSIGSLYITLQRLERKRLLTSRLGDPSPERGGRAKRYYELTRRGLALLKSEVRSTQRMWAGLGLVPDER
jgi:PadR family transcriptional regulator, regulatory protein PadR